MVIDLWRIIVVDVLYSNNIDKKFKKSYLNEFRGREQTNLTYRMIYRKIYKKTKHFLKITSKLQMIK